MRRLALFALLAGAVAACGLDLAGTGPFLLDGGGPGDATTSPADARADAPRDAGATDGASDADAPFVPTGDAAKDVAVDAPPPPPPFTCGANKVNDCYTQCPAAPVACGSSTCVASCDQCGSSKYTCTECPSVFDPTVSGKSCTNLDPLQPCGSPCGCITSSDCKSDTDVCSALHTCIPCGEVGSVGGQCQNGKTCSADAGGFVCQ